MHAHDFAAAERVCATGRVLAPWHDAPPGWERLLALAPRPSVSASESVRLRHALLGLYMAPGSDPEFCVPCAALLHKHAGEFALESVLAAVPPHWPVHALAPFLVRALRSVQHARRSAHVAKAAAFKRSLDATELRWRAVRTLGGLVEEPL